MPPIFFAYSGMVVPYVKGQHEWQHKSFQERSSTWPMLAACFALYYLRDADTLLVLDKKLEPRGQATIATS